MKRRIGAALVLAAPMATPALAQQDIRDVETALLEGIRANGCSMSQQQGEAMIAAMGLTQEQYRQLDQIIEGYGADGLLTIENNVLTLSPALCAPTATTANTTASAPATMPALTQREREFVGLVTKNGCRMSQAVAARVMPIHGFTNQEIEATAQSLLASGVARVEGDALVLSDMACPGRPASATSAPAAAPAPAPAAPAPELADQAAPQPAPAAPAPQTAAADPAPAPGATREDLIAVLRERNCRLSSSDAKDILPGYGIDWDDAKDIARAMLNDGSASEVGDDLVLSPALCADQNAPAVAETAPAADPREVLVAAIRDNGCRMSSDAAKELLPARGLSWDDAKAIAGKMIEDGSARPEGDDIVLSPALCDGATATAAAPAPADPAEAATPATPAPAAAPAIEPDSRFGQMIRIIRENACQITDQEADDIFDPLGYSYSELNGYLDQLIEAGRATFDGDMVRLSPAFCLGISSLEVPAPTKHAMIPGPAARPRTV